MKAVQNLLFLMPLLAAISSFAQNDSLMKLLGKDSAKKEYVTGTFKSPRVIMSHSVEMLQKGVLDFSILHRFGRVNGGLYEFFGLDGPANVRLGLDYGITNNFTVGLGRSNYNKELDGFLKYRVIQQSAGVSSSPISLVVVAGNVLRTAQWTDGIDHFFDDRLNYYGQVIIGRKFTEAFSLQLIPTLLHKNLTDLKTDTHDIIAGGIGGRLKISRRVSFNVDYYYVFNQDGGKGLTNPLSIGVDIETGGHVFQLHFTNATGMNERAILADTNGSWGKGDIEFGFNISRVFQIKKKKG